MTMTQVTVHGVMQRNGGASDEDPDSSEADGPWESATTRPWRSSTRPTSAPTRFCSASGSTTW